MHRHNDEIEMWSLLKNIVYRGPKVKESFALDMESVTCHLMCAWFVVLCIFHALLAIQPAPINISGCLSLIFLRHRFDVSKKSFQCPGPSQEPMITGNRSLSLRQDRYCWNGIERNEMARYWSERRREGTPSKFHPLAWLTTVKPSLFKRAL